MAEWPVASVARTDVIDPALWELAAHDPKLYTFYLRQQGILNPLFDPINVPMIAKIPLAPLATMVLP